jgi:hypothetical protein
VRRALRESAIVRIAALFVGAAFAFDVLVTLLLGRVTVLYTVFGLVYFAIVLTGFTRGARWAVDPVIRTVGRAPEQREPVAGVVRTSARTVRLALDADLKETLSSNARRRSEEARAWLVIGVCFILGGALFVALLSGDALLFAAATLIVFVPAAFVWVLAGPPTSADAERGEMHRTEGEVRLTWVVSRSGRAWTVRVGDRTFHVWDHVGAKLANMRWGVVDYTESGRILRVRDIDGNTVYELAPAAIASVIGYAPWVGPLFLLGWVVLSLVVRATS